MRSVASSPPYKAFFPPLLCRDTSVSSFPPPPRKEPPPAAMDDDDNEISVFDAEKYYYHNFNDTTTTAPPQQQRLVVVPPPPHYGPLLQSSTTNNRSSVVEEGYGRTQPWARPSLSEEASRAASSDTALLNNITRTITTTATNKKNNDGVVFNCWKWVVGICLCGGEKKMEKEMKVSVGSPPERPQNANPNPMHVDDVGRNPSPTAPPPKFPPQFSRTLTVLPSGAGFPFPILGRRPLPPRHSLEILRPSNGSLSPSPAADGEGSGSDASSDLFEIKSFMTQTTATTPMDVASAAAEIAYRMLGYGGGGRGRSFHEADAPPSECYEPSEASIEWSVITAEGFDRGSVTNFSASASASEMGGDDVTSVTRKDPQRPGYGRSGFQDNGGGGGGKRGANPMFMGCSWPVGRTLRR